MQRGSILAKELRTAAELAALIRSRLKDPSGCTVTIAPHASGWTARATCRLNNDRLIQSQVRQIAERLRMFYDLGVSVTEKWPSITRRPAGAAQIGSLLQETVCHISAGGVPKTGA